MRLTQDTRIVVRYEDNSGDITDPVGGLDLQDDTADFPDGGVIVGDPLINWTDEATGVVVDIPDITTLTTEMHGGNNTEHNQNDTYSVFGSNTTDVANEFGFESFDQLLTVYDTVLSDFNANIGGYLKAVARPAGKKCELSFSTELPTNWGADETALSWKNLLLFGCDFGYGLVKEFPGGGAAGYIYFLTSESAPNKALPITLIIYIQNIKVILFNCIGTFDIVANAGEMARINWTFFGQVLSANENRIDLQTPPAVAQVQGATFTGELGHLVIDGVVFENDNYTLKSFGVSIGNKLKHRTDANSIFGFNKPFIVKREPTYTMRIEVEDLSTIDFEDLFRDEIEIGFSGKFSNDYYIVFFGKISVKPQLIDDNGILYWDIKLNGIVHDIITQTGQGNPGTKRTWGIPSASIFGFYFSV